MTVKKDESTIQQEIQIQGMHYNCNLMRNNSGCLPDINGRIVRFGLGNISKQFNDQIKSSDLIGITKVLITPEMVGKTVGVFTAIEVKKEDWNINKKYDKRETAQYNFIQFIKAMGGIASFANSPVQLKEILK